MREPNWVWFTIKWELHRAWKFAIKILKVIREIIGMIFIIAVIAAVIKLLYLVLFKW